MESKDIRWKQRFEYFENALASLKEIIDENSDEATDTVIDASIQRFEIAFELAWKTLQDYLTEQGYIEYKGPKRIIAKAFQDKIIVDGEMWVSMHADRNILSHNYDYDKSRIIYERIVKNYIPLFIQLQRTLTDANL